MIDRAAIFTIYPNSGAWTIPVFVQYYQDCVAQGIEPNNPDINLLDLQLIPAVDSLEKIQQVVGFYRVADPRNRQNHPRFGTLPLHRALIDVCETAGDYTSVLESITNDDCRKFFFCRKVPEISQLFIDYILRPDTVSEDVKALLDPFKVWGSFIPTRFMADADSLHYLKRHSDFLAYVHKMGTTFLSGAGKGDTQKKADCAYSLLRTNKLDLDTIQRYLSHFISDQVYAELSNLSTRQLSEFIDSPYFPILSAEGNIDLYLWSLVAKHLDHLNTLDPQIVLGRITTLASMTSVPCLKQRAKRTTPMQVSWFNIICHLGVYQREHDTIFLASFDPTSVLSRLFDTIIQQGPLKFLTTQLTRPLRISQQGSEDDSRLGQIDTVYNGDSFDVNSTHTYLLLGFFSFKAIARLIKLNFGDHSLLYTLSLPTLKPLIEKMLTMNRLLNKTEREKNLLATLKTHVLSNKASLPVIPCSDKGVPHLRNFNKDALDLIEGFANSGLLNHPDYCCYLIDTFDFEWLLKWSKMTQQQFDGKTLNLLSIFNRAESLEELQAFCQAPEFQSTVEQATEYLIKRFSQQGLQPPSMKIVVKGSGKRSSPSQSRGPSFFSPSADQPVTSLRPAEINELTQRMQENPALLDDPGITAGIRTVLDRARYLADEVHESPPPLKRTKIDADADDPVGPHDEHAHSDSSFHPG